MSETFQHILELVNDGKIRISDHGYDEKTMTTKRQTKMVHEGKYFAEVDVELIKFKGFSP
ncbi:MAG: hypothetical protein OEV66_12360 [Spirochaetia bacterium]|nr:hypothetical protein [Spirochaetia bacterium]